MFKKSRPFWVPFAIAAVLLAGCGRRQIAPIRLANSGTASTGRESTGDKANEPEEAEWGNLAGRFVYQGAAPGAKPIVVTKDQGVCGKHNLVDESLVVGQQNGLKNVVIFIATSKKQELLVHPDYAAATNDVVRLDIKNCRFEPHILSVRTTQTLEMHNSDSVCHDCAIERENPLLSKGETFDCHFDKSKSEPVPVTSGIHTWMKGYVVARDNPYVAVTDDDGRFKIEKLPRGEHEFVVWHERAKQLNLKTESLDVRRGRFKLEVMPCENDLGTVYVSANAFE